MPSCPGRGALAIVTNVGQDAVDAAASGAKRNRRAGSFIVNRERSPARRRTMPYQAKHFGEAGPARRSLFGVTGPARRSLWRSRVAAYGEDVSFWRPDPGVKFAEAKSAQPGAEQPYSRMT